MANPQLSIMLSALDLNLEKVELGQNFFVQVLKERLEETYYNETFEKLNTKEFTEMDFIDLEVMISEVLNNSPLMSTKKKRDLGTSVSAITLKRIFRYGFDMESSSDKRRVHTLEKLSIFLGYQSWQHFISTQTAKFQVGKNFSVHLPTGEELLEIFRVFSEHKKAELQAYKELSAAGMEGFYVLGDAEYLFIQDEVAFRKRMGYSIATHANPSSFEMNYMEICMLSKELAIVAFSSFWQLWWVHLKTYGYLPQFGNGTRFYLVFLWERRWFIASDPFSVLPQLKNYFKQGEFEWTYYANGKPVKFKKMK